MVKTKNTKKNLQWFNDSAEDIRSCCDKALQALHAHYGWQVQLTMVWFSAWLLPV